MDINGIILGKYKYAHLLRIDTFGLFRQLETSTIWTISKLELVWNNMSETCWIRRTTTGNIKRSFFASCKCVPYY